MPKRIFGVGLCWSPSVTSWAHVSMSPDLFCVGLPCGLVAKSCLTLVIPWVVTCQAPLSMKFFQQEYWSGLSFPSLEDHPDPEIKPESWTQVSCTAGRFSTVEPPAKPLEFSVLPLIFFLFKSSTCITLYLLNKNSHFCCVFFFHPLHHMACKILASQPGTEPRQWQWKVWVLTTELQGNSHVCV